MTNPEYDMLMDRINKMWNRGHHRLNWLEYEQVTALILGSPRLTAEEKVDLLKQWLDAFTRRGYFVSSWWSYAANTEKGGSKP